MTQFATALAKRDQPLIILAPGKSKGVDQLLEWMVGYPKVLGYLVITYFSHRKRHSRVCLIALWTVFNSAYMRTSPNLPKFWKYTNSLFNTVVERLVSESLWG